MVEENVFNLLRLPSLVLGRIAHFLDVPSLKRLRLACKFAKGIVDGPQTIKRIVINVSNADRIHELLHSQTLWNNFHFIITDQWLSHHHNHLLSHWADYFGATAKVISISHKSESKPYIRSAYPVIPLLRLLLHCTNIESIEMDEIDFTTISPMNWSLIKKSWRHVRHLHLARVTFISDNSRCYFSEIVQCADYLQTITLPRNQASQNSTSSLPVRMNNPDHSFRAYELSVISEYEEFIVFPLINRIKNEVSTRGHSSIKSVTCPEELLSLNTYVQLAKLCVKTSITLYHSSPSIISSHILRTSSNEDMRISNCLGSVFGVNEQLIRQPLPKLKYLEIDKNNFLFTSDEPYKVPEFPTLETIRLNLATWSLTSRDDTASVKRLSQFITCLQSRNRTSVTKIFMQKFPLISHSTTPDNLQRPDLLHSFTNLTHLDLDFVEYLPEEFANLWERLKKLKKVRLMHCLGLNDSAILGTKDDQSMLSLSFLTHLTLHKVGRITAISYEQVFSKMKLFHLAHSPDEKYPIGDSAFNALIKGIAWENLESFHFAKLGFSTYREKTEFAQKFGGRLSIQMRHRACGSYKEGDDIDEMSENFNKDCNCC